MIITFVLSGIEKSPSGGYKIIYEYCNRLADNGHKINIIYQTNNQFKYKFLGKFGRKFFLKLVKSIFPRWIKLSKQINKYILDDYTDVGNLPIADCIFATSVDTVSFVSNLDSKFGTKYYFIQGYENWNESDEYVKETYKLDLIKIVVANWLKKIVDKYSNHESYLISNPIDFNDFYLYNPIENRNDPIITCLYHSGAHKGVKDLLKALIIVKKRIPKLKVNFSGTPKRPDNLESWINYTQNASTEKLLHLYNEASIFACASINEGFGLTCVETMACGCALVSTKFDGVFEYAVNMENSLLSEAKDPEELAKNIIFLLENNIRRYEIARNGNNSVKNKNWPKAIEEFERILLQNESY